MTKYFCDICNQQIKSDPITWNRNESFNRSLELPRENYDVCDLCDAKIQKFIKNLENE